MSSLYNPQPYMISSESWESYSRDKQFEIIRKNNENCKLLTKLKEEKRLTEAEKTYKKVPFWYYPKISKSKLK